MNKYNHGLLEVAREMRGFTQEKAATLIGISQGKLSKAEHQLQTLPDAVFLKAAEVYDFPISFFSRNVDRSSEECFYFRRKLTISAKSIESFKAQIQVLKLIFDDILAPIELPECTLPSLSPKDYSIKEIASAIRHKLGIGYGPVPNLTSILEKNGIQVFKFDFGTNKLDGLSSITSSGYKFIFLNSQMPNDRNRFSLAHELGHVIMHLGQGEPGSEELEQEADDFASEFLMPEDEISEMLYNINISTLAELKRRWKVSMRALIRRARDLKCISDNTYRSYQILFSRKGYNKLEPLPLATETPTIIRDSLDLYKRELGYNDSDIMQVMHINPADYNKWFKVTSIFPLNFKISLN